MCKNEYFLHYRYIPTEEAPYVDESLLFKLIYAENRDEVTEICEKEGREVVSISLIGKCL